MEVSTQINTRLTSVELIFPVQQFVVPVQQTVADWGLCVPTLTLVVEQASHAHFLRFTNRTDFPWLRRSCRPLGPSSPHGSMVQTNVGQLVTLCNLSLGLIWYLSTYYI